MYPSLRNLMETVASSRDQKAIVRQKMKNFDHGGCHHGQAAGPLHRSRGAWLMLRRYIDLIEGAESFVFEELADLASDEFRQWFVGSKIVNPDGSPKMVYHGTRRGGFEKFVTHQHSRSPAFFFTDSRPMALTYSGQSNDIDGTKNHPTATKSGVYRAYLSIKNPKVIDWKGDYFQNRQGVHTHDAVAEAMAEGHDGAIIRNVNDPGGFAMMMQNRGEVPEGPDIVGDLYVAFDPDQIRIAPVRR